MIELRNIYRTYQMGDTEIHALQDVSLHIKPGEFVAIMGPSGSGKSTLLHLLGFLDGPDQGEYLLNGKKVSGLSDDELATLRSHVAGFIFQQFHLLPRKTALENVRLPLRYNGGISGKEAEKQIDKVGLQDRARHRPKELSGGQQQRIAIARALAKDPPIIFADEPTGNLDSKSEAEILAILKDLHSQGKTILMVTHEHDLAKQADRVISMRDGKIVSDVQNRSPASPLKEEISFKKLDSRSHFPRLAEISNNFREAAQAIWDSKLRSFLSILGILIGVASVIAMLALGRGAKDEMSKAFAHLGTNLLSVRPGAPRMHGVSLATGSTTRFTARNATEIAELAEIKRVTPTVRGRVQAVARGNNWNTQLQGVGKDYFEIRASQPTSGRIFTEEEIHKRAKVLLLGETVAIELFGEHDPIGEPIKLNRINFTIIGTLPGKGTGPGGDRDDVVVIPYTTAMFRVLGKDYIDGIDAEVWSASLVDSAQTSIKRLLRDRFHVRSDQDDPFHVRNMAEIREAFTGMTDTMTLLLGAIAAISLFVGGIGIMNIMLVSVTERTREIGLRKAIGARRIDIVIQFLVEAIVLTGLGGGLGVAIGAGGAILLATLSGWTTKVTVSSILLAGLFSIAVGVGFGLWPAQKAARLNPINALRHE